jgi:hypothetical protein
MCLPSPCIDCSEVVAVKPMDKPCQWSGNVAMYCCRRAYQCSHNPNILKTRKSSGDQAAKDTQRYYQASNDSKSENDSVCACTNRGGLMSIGVHYLD